MTSKGKEERAPGRPHVFALGFVFLAIAGFQIKTGGHNNLTSLYLLVGTYYIWQEGYRKDHSQWKVNPTTILILFLAVWAVLLYSVTLRETERKNAVKKKEIPYIDQLVTQYNQALPCRFVGDDSLMKVSMRDSNTLDFLYKISKTTAENLINSKEQIVENFRAVLQDKLKRIHPKQINQLKWNNISFCHRFLNDDEEAVITITIYP